MTELSYWWTTSGTPAGDQQASYTQAHLATISKILAACSGFEGVAPGYRSELAGTVPAANTVRIAAGGAVVDGKPYDNSGNVDVNIPSAVGGGNTRIDRVVLKALWGTTFTVRVTRVPGTDAASPVAPTITQTSGTEYDILLYQALVNTGGTVTLTDERTFASRVVNYRQGGMATHWTAQGTTNYAPGSMMMLCGTIQATIPANQNDDDFTVTFPVAFSYYPLVFLQVYDTSYYDITATCIYPETTYFDGNVHVHTTGGSNRDVSIFWFAIGPK